MPGPLIAVPHWRAPTWERTKCYYDSLQAAGAEYVLVDGPGLPGGARGLVLTGGVDIDPKLYGEKRAPGTDRPHKERDEHELGLLRQALERDLPILCICRGHQLLNVGLGGSLVQHVENPAHRWLDGGDSNWHEVTVLDPPEAGRLAGVYGASAVLRVNSRHHQGVTADRLAPGLEVVARAQDGLVEGVESTSHRWAVGVQWLPERQEMLQHSNALFEAFVAACDAL